MAAVNKTELRKMLIRLACSVDEIESKAVRASDPLSRKMFSGKADGIGYSVTLLADYFDIDLPVEYELGQRRKEIVAI